MEYVLCNKLTSIYKNEKDFLSYFDLISENLGKVPASGLTIIEMKKVLELLDRLKTNEEIKIEEQEYQYLLKSIMSTKWTVIHKDLVEFYDYLNSLNKKK